MRPFLTGLAQFPARLAPHLSTAHDHLGAVAAAAVLSLLADQLEDFLTDNPVAVVTIAFSLLGALGMLAIDRRPHPNVYLPPPVSDEELVELQAVMLASVEKAESLPKPPPAHELVYRQIRSFATRMVKDRDSVYGYECDELIHVCQEVAEWRHTVIGEDHFAAERAKILATLARFRFDLWYSPGGPDRFGVRIRRCRERVGMSQLEVATALDVDQGTVSRWEHGRAHPRPRMCNTLGELFGMDACYFMGGGDV